MSGPQKVEFEKHWPSLTDGKIPTGEFLDTCQVILQFLGILGNMFSPVRKDVEGNINKLYVKYDRDPKKYATIHDLVTVPAEPPCAIESLKWLKRGLHFVYLLLDSVVESHEKNVNQSLVDACVKAYETSLKNYHSWVVQKLALACIRTICPSREDFLNSIKSGKEISDEELLQGLKIFVNGLEQNLQHIFSLYVELGFDTVSVLK